MSYFSQRFLSAFSQLINTCLWLQHDSNLLFLNKKDTKNFQLPLLANQLSDPVAEHKIKWGDYIYFPAGSIPI